MPMLQSPQRTRSRHEVRLLPVWRRKVFCLRLFYLPGNFIKIVLVSKKRSARIALRRSRKCCYRNPPQAENVAGDILNSVPGNFIKIVLVSKKRSARIALRRNGKCCYYLTNKNIMYYNSNGQIQL